jgi:hypothetical protein
VGVWYGDSFVLLSETAAMVEPASHGERL